MGEHQPERQPRQECRGEESLSELGYADARVDPVRVSGVIMVRGRPLEVDDTLVYLTKCL